MTARYREASIVTPSCAIWHIHDTGQKNNNNNKSWWEHAYLILEYMVSLRAVGFESGKDLLASITLFSPFMWMEARQNHVYRICPVISRKAVFSHFFQQVDTFLDKPLSERMESKRERKRKREFETEMSYGARDRSKSM
jgi:hypothetical protein